MTNEEKFRKGIVVYTYEEDYVCELWGASTKHPDSIFRMSDDIENKRFEPNPYSELKVADVYQWLLSIASRMMWKETAKRVVEFATEEYFGRPNEEDWGIKADE